MENNNLFLLDETLEKYSDIPGSLITILQRTQDIYGYIPRDAVEYISDKTGIACSKIMGVATFYAQFRFKPVGKYLIMLCKGTACHVNGADGIERAIYDELGILDGGTTEDGLFSLKKVACLGCCSLSPVMMINDKAYGNLTPELTRSILSQLRREAE